MPPTLLHPPKPERPPLSQFRRTTRRRELKRLALRVCTFVAVALLAWGAWYLANRGFGRTWRAAVAEELRKNGVEASMRRLTLDPFRGLVAQDVRIYDFKNRDHPLAVISEVALDINYAALLHRQPFLNALEIRDADVTFPNIYGDPAAPPARLRQLRAHIIFPPEQIYIRQAEGIFSGVRISATGQLIKRGDYRPQRVVTEEEWRQRMELLQRVAHELNQFRAAGDGPTLQVKFSGDLARMEEAHVDATLRSEQLQRSSYEWRNLHATAEWKEQQLHLTTLAWQDATGSFTGRGSWNTPAARLEFQAQSSIQLKQFAEAFGFGSYVADVTFTTPPQLQVSGSFDFSGDELQRRIIGRVELGSFSFRDVPFVGLAGDFSWDGARTMLRDVRLRHESGELLADALDAPEAFRTTIDSNISPAAFRPLLPGGVAKFVGEWEFPRSPAVRLTVAGTSRHPRSWTAEGNVTLQRTRFRGVWMNSASADVRIADGALTFTDLRVARPEGTGTGAFSYDFVHQRVQVQNVRTSLNPAEVIHWIEPKLHRTIAPYRFRTAPNVVANGTATFADPRETRLEIGVDAPGGMDYQFLGKTLPFDRVAGQLHIEGDHVQLNQGEAQLFSGTVRGAAEMRTGEQSTATLVVEGVDFARLANLLFGSKASRGQLDGRYEFSMQEGEPRTMRGSGNLRVTDGDVFALPMFSELASSLLRAAALRATRTATATFTVADGAIRTDDIEVAGRLFSMRGRADIHFLDDRLEMDLRITPHGPGTLLPAAYQLLEFRGEGSLTNPQWQRKRP
jgi:hypothetical protein